MEEAAHHQAEDGPATRALLAALLRTLDVTVLCPLHALLLADRVRFWRSSSGGGSGRDAGAGIR